MRSLKRLAEGMQTVTHPPGVARRRRRARVGKPPAMTAVGQTGRMQQLLAEVVVPHWGAIMPILGEGSIALVVHDPDDEGVTRLRSLGWDESSPVFEMRRHDAERMARDCVAMGDARTAAWLLAREPGRLLVVAGCETLFLNLCRRGETG
jgi:hypothetical protein